MLAIALDATQITEYSFCPLSWYYRYREHLARTGADRKSLDLGTIMHLYLAEYYDQQSQGISYDEAAKAAVIKLKDNKEIHELDPSGEFNQFIGQRFIAYVMKYSQSDFRAFKTAGLPLQSAVATNAAIEVGFSKKIYEDSNFTFIIEGRIDLLAYIDDKIYFVDHKTQGRKANLYKYKPQFLTYALATELEYGLINYIGMTKEVNNDTFRRELIKFPKWMVERWRYYIIDKVFLPLAIKLEKYQWIREHVNDDQILRFTTNLERKLFESERRLTSCSGAFDSMPCMFTDLCETSDPQMVQNIKSFQYHQIQPWSPWSENE